MNLSSLFESQNIIGTFFKIAAVLFALIYLLYTLVINKQVDVMNKTLTDKLDPLVALVSSVQVAAAFVLFIIAVFLV
ncbi:hypothetical protein M1328_05675 [Patescibacteria group bacterium]|nr:hypothetical protein [Patescibacteria group bacterium]